MKGQGREGEVVVSVVSGNAPESIAGFEITFGNYISQRGLGSLLVRRCAFTDTNRSLRPSLSFLRADSRSRQAWLLLFRRGAKLVCCLAKIARQVKKIY